MIVKKTILVLGSGGLLGSYFSNQQFELGWDVIFHSRSLDKLANADLEKMNETSKMLDLIKPDIILNLAGITSVDNCESFPNTAYLGNVKTLENVVSWIEYNKNQTQLIHISTDQVYDGLGPHDESMVSLKNYYAFSKYAGELVAKRVNSTILRTNFFGKSTCSKRSSLTDWLYVNLKEGNDIQVFEDVKFSPLSMSTLFEVINKIIEHDLRGVFNLGSRDGMSKADFAFKFASSINLSSKNMYRCATTEVDFLKTYRPNDMRLNSERIESHLNISLPALDDEIKKVAKEYTK
ncbi:sugar nucleotide-binding protein [Psychrobacter sp. HY3-MNA-CIBAN-0198]|uniref:sugar nucleotide-binding protein n=1 Tax=Psychrobacter sp. HY3-MNA-CIBAN-0198 TaxID=3140441 RepID=UPI00332581E9